MDDSKVLTVQVNNRPQVVYDDNEVTFSRKYGQANPISFETKVKCVQNREKLSELKRNTTTAAADC